MPYSNSTQGPNETEHGSKQTTMEQQSHMMFSPRTESVPVLDEEHGPRDTYVEGSCDIMNKTTSK